MIAIKSCLQPKCDFYINIRHAENGRISSGFDQEKSMFENPTPLILFSNLEQTRIFTEKTCFSQTQT